MKTRRHLEEEGIVEELKENHIFSSTATGKKNEKPLAYGPFC